MILQALACPIVDQGEVWDRVLERKTTLVLKETLKEEDLDAIELPRVVKVAAGNPANKWGSNISAARCRDGHHREFTASHKLYIPMMFVATTRVFCLF